MRYVHFLHIPHNFYLFREYILFSHDTISNNRDGGYPYSFLKAVEK